MPWRIGVYQKPVGIGDIRHNFIVVKDDDGNVQAEFNGGPVDKNGRFIPLDLFTINSRISGGVLGVDVRRSPASPLYANDPRAQLVQEIPVTREQALAAVSAAASCAREINALRLPYLMSGTGPIIDRHNENSTPLLPTGFNSNGAASTLLACMGIPVRNPAIDRQFGSGQLILPPSQIDEIRQQNRDVLPGDQIPLPRPRPQIRGGNSNGPLPSIGRVGGYEEATPTAAYSERAMSSSSYPDRNAWALTGNGILNGLALGGEGSADEGSVQESITGNTLMPGNGILSGVRLSLGEGPQTDGLSPGNESPWAQAVREAWERRVRDAADVGNRPAPNRAWLGD